MILASTNVLASKASGNPFVTEHNEILKFQTDAPYLNPYIAIPLMLYQNVLTVNICPS